MRIESETEPVETPDSGAWTVEALVRVDLTGPSEYDAKGGGVVMKTIRGSESADPTPVVE